MRSEAEHHPPQKARKDGKREDRDVNERSNGVSKTNDRVAPKAMPLLTQCARYSECGEMIKRREKAYRSTR